MSSTSINYVEDLREDLKDPIEAAAYLNAALEDGSVDGFLLALRDVTETRAEGQILFSEIEERELAHLFGLLERIGLTLAVQVKTNVA